MYQLGTGGVNKQARFCPTGKIMLIKQQYAKKTIVIKKKQWQHEGLLGGNESTTIKKTYCYPIDFYTNRHQILNRETKDAELITGCYLKLLNLSWGYHTAHIA